MRKIFSFYAMLGGMFIVAVALNSYTAAAGKQYSFVTTAGQAGLAEIAMGNLALAKSQNEEVKQFAQKMIADHSSAGDQLKALATKKDYEFPADASAEQKTNADAIGSLSGAAFDKAYSQTAVADHQAALALFDKEAKSGSDPDVKAWAAATLPTIKSHLRAAEALDSKIK